ncbi:MAG: ABC transporter substrate-binding protein [Nitrososphaeria archaeon]
MRGISRTILAVAVIVLVVIVGAVAVLMQPPTPTITTTTTTTTATTTTATTSTTITTTTATTTTATTTTVTTSPTTTTTTIKPPNPDTLVQETIGEPDYVDPAVDYETAGGEIIMNVYETLMWYDGESATKVIPWLAESYQMSADGKSYTFTLRKGIKFHDGTPFNAKAVNYSIVRAILIADPNGPAWMLGPLKGAEELMYSIQDGVATQDDVAAWLASKPIEVLDEYTVRMNLDYPYSPWLSVLAYTVTAIVSPTYVEAHGGIVVGEHNEWMDRHAEAGTGPYILKSWEPNVLTLVRNDAYWGGPKGNIKPVLKTVIIKGVADANTRLLDLLKGDADFAYVPVTHIDQLIDMTTWFNEKKIVVKPEVADKVRVTGPYETFNLDFIAFNLNIKDEITKQPAAFQPFRDIRVRKAFVYAFDIDQYLRDVVKYFAIQPNGPVPKGMFGYNPSIPTQQYNLTKAKELLLQAGPDLGFSPQNPKTMTLYYNTGNLAREKAALLIASAINSLNVGLVIQVVPLDWPAFLAKQRARALPFFVLGWAPDYVDPDDYLIPFGHGQKGTFPIVIGYNNPELNTLIEQQAVEADPVKRQAIIDQIVNTLNSEYIYLWTAQATARHVERTWVKGWYYNPAYPGNYFATISKG